MKKIQLSILTLAGLVLCGACDYYEGVGPIPRFLYKSYITSYCDLQTISISERFYFSVDETNKIVTQGYIDVTSLDGNRGKTFRIDDGIALLIECWGDLTSGGARYNALRDELGDTLFNRKILVINPLPHALTEMLDGFQITVNEDYGPNYSAGADVSALFTIVYEYPYAVIQNNYLTPEKAYRYTHTAEELPQAVYKDNLSTVNLIDKKALGCRFYFMLTRAPAKSGAYTFTIEMRMADGKVLTATSRPISIEVP